MVPPKDFYTAPALIPEGSILDIVFKCLQIIAIACVGFLIVLAVIEYYSKR